MQALLSRLSSVFAVARQRLFRLAQALHRYLLLTPLQLLLVGLGCMALAASSDLANTYDAPRSGGPIVAFLLFLTLLLAFALFLIACRAAPPQPIVRRRHLLRWLIYPVLLWSLFTAYQTASITLHGFATALTIAPPQYGSDDLYYNHYNAWLLLHGENPYVGQHLVAALRYFDTTAYTPLARGQFANPRHYPTLAERDAVIKRYLANSQAIPPEIEPATTHSYPAGAFLVDLPAVWAGAPSIAITQLLLLLLLWALICRATPPTWQPLALLLLLTMADGVREVAGADFEVWPLALLAFAWLTRERRWASALLLGAACAIKQTAWLAAPFYIIWVWRRCGREEAIRRAGLTLATFVVINLPWMIASPREWFASLLLPISLPLLPDGSGIIALALTNILPLFPSWVYSLVELALLVGALWWYWRNWRRYPFAGLVLPLLPLLGAWRSSERYFVLLPLVAVLAAVLTLRLPRGDKADNETAVASEQR